MITKIDRNKLEKMQSLEEVVSTFFRVKFNGRTLVIPQESMDDGLAEDYDSLGKKYRADSYQQIAQDFISKCYKSKGKVLDVGCGSGLLAKEISNITDSEIIGIDVSRDMLDLARKNCDSNVSFINTSVYNLSSSFSKVNYVVCRNALHRFKDVRKALHEMYSVLNQGGVMYLRDLRRDADWKTIVERIGEQRWKSDRLVVDYVGAMAQMLTTEELGTTLMSLGINNFKFYNGFYSGSQESFEKGRAVEYVAIVKKN